VARFKLENEMRERREKKEGNVGYVKIKKNHV